MPADKGLPDQLTPLREPTTFILLALSTGEKHGYAILKEVESLSQGRIRLSTGTLYGALARLLDQGVIQKSADGEGGEPDGDGPAGTRVRKYYELTRHGRRVLEAELGRMESLLSAARRELGIEGASWHTRL
jgi:DNA-binding PadR family transcriptional regulator